MLSATFMIVVFLERFVSNNFLFRGQCFWKDKRFLFFIDYAYFCCLIIDSPRVSGFSRIPNLFSCSFDSSRRYKYNTYNHFCTVFHKLSINLFLSSPIDRSRVHLLRITKFRTLFFSFFIRN